MLVEVLEELELVEVLEVVVGLMVLEELELELFDVDVGVDDVLETLEVLDEEVVVTFVVEELEEDEDDVGFDVVDDTVDEITHLDGSAGGVTPLRAVLTTS